MHSEVLLKLSSNLRASKFPEHKKSGFRRPPVAFQNNWISSQSVQVSPWSQVNRRLTQPCWIAVNVSVQRETNVNVACKIRR